MGWIIENLTGALDGNNTIFTISTAPVLESLSVIHAGIRYRRVAGIPSGSEFNISGTTITMGRAPAATDALWQRSFIDAWKNYSP
jgi:hypothetical protein